MKKPVLRSAAALLAVLLCLSITAFAAENPALISNGNVSIASDYLIEGNVYSANGNIAFGTGSAASCILDGDAVVTEGHEVTFFNQWNMPDFRGDKVTDNSLNFNFTAVSAPAVPDGIASVTSLSSHNITESFSIQTLSLGGDYVIDTSASDIYIVTDTINFTWGSLTVTGGNKAYIVVNSGLTFNGGTEINSNGNLALIINNNATFQNYSVSYADMYITGTSLVANGGGTLYGDVYITNTSCLISGNYSVYGTVYAPETDLSMSGATTIYGTVIAKSFSNPGKFTIIYDPYYSHVPEDNTQTVIVGGGEGEPEDTSLIPGNAVTRASILGTLRYDRAYIYGYTDTQMAPNAYVKRSEASAMIYRLLKQNDKLEGYAQETATFPDVDGSEWYGTAAGFFEFIRVYNSNNGANNLFPERNITRGEAAKLFAFAMGVGDIEAEDVFSDVVPSNKYYKYITALANKGLLIGNGDGTFSPDAYMTRAEYVTVFNRIIGRDDRYDYTTDVDGNPVVCQFTDMDPDAWYYADMMRATNSFTGYKVDFSARAERNVLDDYS